MRTLLSTLCAALLLSACGQSGPLYLPDRSSPKAAKKPAAAKTAVPAQAGSPPAVSGQPPAPAEATNPPPAP